MAKMKKKGKIKTTTKKPKTITKQNLLKKQILNDTSLTFYFIAYKRVSFDNGILYEM